MKSGNRLVLGIVVVVLAIGVVTFLNRLKGPRGDLVKEVKLDHTPVQVRAVRRDTLTETITHTGSLKARRDVILTAEVAGKVQRKVKDLGDRCRMGEIAVRLDPESYHLALLQAEAGLSRVKAQLEQAKRDLTRTDRLARKSTVADRTLEHAQTSVHTASAAAKQAEAAVNMARRNLRETTVRCPFDGVVAESPVELGQAVGPQTPLVRLVDTRTLTLTIKVSASELSRLAVGQKVDIMDLARSEERFTGKVSRLGVAADRTTHNFPVEISLPPKEGRPRPGQVVRATITIAHHADVLAVPKESVLAQGSKAALFVAVDGRAKEQRVKLGPSIDNLVIISGGLAAGQQVIVKGHHGLKDGDLVKSVAGKRETSPLPATTGDRTAAIPPDAGKTP